MASFNTGKLLNVAVVVVGAVVALAILAALLPTFLGSVEDVNENLSTGTTGDATADTILGIMPILVGIGAVFALVGLIFASIRLSRR